MGGCTARPTRPAQTIFKIVNKTNRDFTIEVEDVNGNHWVGNDRPDWKFNRVTIESGSSREEKIQLSGFERQNLFNMKFLFTDNTRDVVNIYGSQNYLYDLYHMHSSHDISLRLWENNNARNVEVLEVRNTQRQLTNERAEEIRREGERAMLKKLYETAIDKFEAACEMANESHTINSINQKLEEARSALRAQQLNSEGKEMMKNQKYEEAKEKFEKALNLTTDQNLIEEISNNVKKVTKKRDNSLAEKMNQEGEEAMKVKKYEEARKKFEEAYKLSNESSTSQKVLQNLERAKSESRVEKLNEEGEELMRMKRFEEAVKKFDEGLNLAREESTIGEIRENRNLAVGKKQRNDEAKAINEDGEKKMKMKQFEAALEQFEKASEMAEESVTIEKIKTNKVESLNEFGHFLYEKGWVLENDETEDKSEEAARKFAEAREVIRKALFLRDSPLQRTYLKIVESKIAGNDTYNRALELNKEALGLYQEAKLSGDYSTTKKKYKQVLEKYEEAAKKFEEWIKDDQKFADSARFVRRQMEDVKKAIAEIEEEELREGEIGVNVGKKTGNEESELIDQNVVNEEN